VRRAAVQVVEGAGNEKLIQKRRAAKTTIRKSMAGKKAEARLCAVLRGD